MKSCFHYVNVGNDWSCRSFTDPAKYVSLIISNFLYGFSCNFLHCLRPSSCILGFQEAQHYWVVILVSMNNNQIISQPTDQSTQQQS